MLQGRKATTTRASQRLGAASQVVSEADISFMDTEPVDFEVSDIEELSLRDMEHMEEVDDGSGNEGCQTEKNGGTGSENESTGEQSERESDEEGEADNGKENRRKGTIKIKVTSKRVEEIKTPRSQGRKGVKATQSSFGFGSPTMSALTNLESLSCYNQQGDEDSIIDTPYDITNAPSHEVKRVYTELMETFKSCEDDLEDQEGRRVLKTNIQHGDILYRQLENSMAPDPDETESQFGARTARNSTIGTSNLLMASRHAKLCSRMLFLKAKSMGNVAGAFKINEFVDAVREKIKDDAVDETYRPITAAKKLVFLFENAATTAPCFAVQFEGVDKEELFAQQQAPEEPIQPKQAKPRRTKDENNAGNATQTEILNKSSVNPDKQDNEGLTAGQKEMLKNVKAKYNEQGNEPVGLQEVTKGSDMHGALRDLFGAAFLVRDGHLNVSVKEGSTDESHPLTSVVVKPDKPPAKDNFGVDRSERYQTILSFTAADLKKMLAASANNA